MKASCIASKVFFSVKHPDFPERVPIEMYLHTRQAFDLFHKLGERLMDYFARESKELDAHGLRPRRTKVMKYIKIIPITNPSTKALHSSPTESHTQPRTLASKVIVFGIICCGIYYGKRWSN